ncbi:unnamed protein product [Symbiodinium sp. CCMP2456]|nr:unnamed protein product [Symbiodinium sp. CCMP2456]
MAFEGAALAEKRICLLKHKYNVTACQIYLLGLSDEELKEGIINYTRQFYLPLTDHWWWNTYLAFREFGGFNFKINDLIRERISSLANAVWIVLPPFEDGMRAREVALQPWFPGIGLSENTMITSNVWTAQYAKMMSYFRNESHWPADVAKWLRHSDMMALFYPDGRLF